MSTLGRCTVASCWITVIARRWGAKLFIWWPHFQHKSEFVATSETKVRRVHRLCADNCQLTLNQVIFSKITKSGENARSIFYFPPVSQTSNMLHSWVENSTAQLIPTDLSFLKLISHWMDWSLENTPRLPNSLKEFTTCILLNWNTMEGGRWRMFSSMCCS